WLSPESIYSKIVLRQKTYGWLIANNPTRQCRFIACVIWALWTDRNKWVHKRKRRSRV
ncbi:hypothetical protein Gotri_001165, partial [Gossypium trilobum]|nr:hypothetical protein [Gossypium trilobum]